MREDLLHFIWKYKKVPLKDVYTSQQESISIVDSGTHNHFSGPDFFNARIAIGGQLWVGNVEMHINSSDWYVHGHQEDRTYDNVILHVVWKDDTAVFRKDGSEIPALELATYVSQELLHTYQDLFDNKRYSFINCEATISQVDTFVVDNWLERLYFDRLEQKSLEVVGLLEQAKNDWEQVLFALLLKNFGLKVNGDAFLSLAYALDFSVVRKLQRHPMQLESVFFGMSHLLTNDKVVDRYFIELKEEYAYLTRKFNLNNMAVLKPDFFKLRPPNFPTIRLSQLANLYHTHQCLFEKVIQAKNLATLYTIFNGVASDYWNTHFTFGKESKPKPKRLTKRFVDLILINTILPLKFCYARYLGRDENEELIQIGTQIKGEQNSILQNFRNLGILAENAQNSQGILQLYNEYCTRNRCLQCSIGCGLLNRND